MTRLLTEAVVRPVTLSDYNTRMVLMGAVLLGISASLIGAFLLLRKRSLIGDVVGHSALPGIVIAFLVIESVTPGSGKNAAGLLSGAAIAGLLGAQCVSLIRRFTRVRNDAALAVVLSAFYGAGVALLSVAQRVPAGSSAGLKDFLNGRAATILAQDVWLFAGASLTILIVTCALFKELTLLCFDEDFAASAGLPVFWLDGILTALATAVAVIGMQTVGLLLVTAVLIIPPAAARFWTNDVRAMAVISALIGGLAAAAGVISSALVPRLATGPMIVLSAGAIFAMSLLIGRKRGVLWDWFQQRRDVLRADRIDLLRAIYEAIESEGGLPTEPRTSSGDVRAVVTRAQLAPFRKWTASRLERALNRATRDGRLQPLRPGEFGVTAAAWQEASRIARNHRLWELYLIRHADVAPASVDRSADLIEHVLDPALVMELEAALNRSPLQVPRNPHAD